MTLKNVTAETYAQALAYAGEVRSSARDRAAGNIARAAAGDACQCGRAFTETNPAEFRHFVDAAARITSTGTWLGSVGCRFCNMRDEVVRDAMPGRVLPFEYVAATFHVPHVFAPGTTRGDIIRHGETVSVARQATKADADVVADAARWIR